MDLNDIKKIIEEDGGKLIIVENGEPVMVITSFDEYKKKKKLTSEVKETPVVTEKSSIEEIKIEDLPF